MADICRKVRRRSFTQMDNEPINDPELKYEDIGLLLYVMSKPDNWTIYKNELISSHANGRESVNAILKRLEKKGYLLISQSRSEKGYFAFNQYIFSDRAFDFGDEIEFVPDLPINNTQSKTPSPTEVLSVDGKPSTDNRQRETVNGIPTTNNTIKNNTLNNNIGVTVGFLEKFGQELPETLIPFFTELSSEEIELVLVTLEDRKNSGKIKNPVGLLKSNPDSVIKSILSGTFYLDIDPEIIEFQNYTGIILTHENMTAYKDLRDKYSKQEVFKAGSIAAEKNAGFNYMVAVLTNTKPEQKYPEIFSLPEPVKYVPAESISKGVTECN